MNIVTHGLASLALQRVFAPRAPRPVILAAIVVGVAPDIDYFSAFFGPSAFLSTHHAFTHSALGAVCFAGLASLAVKFSSGGIASNSSATTADSDGKKFTDPKSFSVQAAFILFFLTAAFHITLDTFQSEGVALFSPFKSARFALDWLPEFDPWILTILVVAVLLPELARLVSDEIGARSKKPRGVSAAVAALVLIVFYMGVRAAFHTNAIAMMQSRSYRGESPRRIAAFPESLSLFTWHGLAETGSAMHEVPVVVGGAFDPDRGLDIFKPESSPLLDIARSTSAARKFLLFARFPKATVEQTERGYAIVLRDLRYAATESTQREVAASIELDRSGKVVDQELVWVKELGGR